MTEAAASFEDFLKTKTQSFDDLFSESVYQKKLMLQNQPIGIDYMHAVMQLVCQKLLLNVASAQHLKDSKSRKTLLDVGGSFSFICFASSFYDVVSLEPRNNQMQIQIPDICNITNVIGEAQKIPINNDSLDVITSLHSIEHFGLGRYGDEVDYFGDYKAVHEFKRVLSPEGFLITGVPTSKTSKVEFNEQRTYKPSDFDKMVESTGLVKQFGAITYAPGHNSAGHLIDVETSIESYNDHFTPPVYVAVYKKVKS